MTCHKAIVVITGKAHCFHDYIYKSKYITVNSFGAHWVKNIKDNAIYLNKQQIKDAVAYLLYNVVSLLALKSSTRL